jgi:protein-tyrosine phosphatase
MTHFLDRPFAFSALAAPGLGPNGLMLCRCPGLRGDRPTGTTPDSTATLEADLTLLISNGATGLVTLIGEDEREKLGVSALPRLAIDKGLAWREFPITDRTAPTAGRQAEFDQLLDTLLAGLADGNRVAIHCQAGLGRTGLLAASLLVQSGTGPNDAIALVRSARPGSIETAGQENFIQKIGLPGLE